jgi:hypothetical protein
MAQVLPENALVTVAALLAVAPTAVPIPQGPNADSLPAFDGNAVATGTARSQSDQDRRGFCDERSAYQGS